MNNIVKHHEYMLENSDVKNVPIVAFIFSDGTKKTYPVGYRVRGLRHNNTRPIGIEWYEDSVGYIPSGEDIEWMYEELRYVFDRSVRFEDAVEGLLNE